jgi:predicted nucleotidyltransferase
MDKHKILEQINSQNKILRDKYHVKTIGVFGSFARGDETENSDIDILVDFDLPIGFFDFIRLENDLSKILGKKVDLITKKAIKPAVKDNILREVIYV